MFVELVPWGDRGQENNLVSGGETLPGLRRPVSLAQGQTSTREVHVSGTAEVSASPDRAQVAVLVSSTKEAAAEAKKSVCRRLDYITQSLQQQGLQVRAPRESCLVRDRKRRARGEGRTGILAHGFWSRRGGVEGVGHLRRFCLNGNTWYQDLEE